MSKAVLYKRASNDLKNQMIKLWRACFGEDEGYARLFFDNRYSPEIGFVALCGESLAGMMFALPITICDNGEEYDASYIYGVATVAAFRGMGISTALLNYAHGQLKNQGKQLSVLVPADKGLFDFYQKRGFSSTIDILQQHYTAGDESAPLNSVSLLSQKPFRDSFFSTCPTFIKWDEHSLSYLDKEISYLGGETLAFSSGGKGGYAVCYPESDSVVIKEWAAKELYSDVLDSIAGRFNKKSVVLRLSHATCAPLAEARPFAMTFGYLPERKKQISAGAYLSLVLD